MNAHSTPNCHTFSPTFWMKSFKAIFGISVILFFVSACTLRHTAVENDNDSMTTNAVLWPHESSDLSPDTRLYFGRLENGFRYVFLKNNTPADRVSLHLYVQTGSLNETSDEQGIAHFLEHMQFNGSIHFQPDELVKYFQRIGMQFGPDANAHTGFSDTVYDILLPRGDQQSLSEAMHVLNEYAQGALLLPKEIQKEINIVLAEKRSRDSSSYRIIQEVFKFELPGTLPPQRFPIGQTETIQRFDQPKMKNFYDTWYRPERMILVVVGQFDPDEARRLAENQFSELRPRAKEVESPNFGSFEHHGSNPFYYFEKNIGTTTVRIETISRENQPLDSSEFRYRELLEELANQILNERLSKLIQKPNAPITESGSGSGFFLRKVRYVEISAQCEPQNWEKALHLIEQTLRRALKYGFTIEELERAKKEKIAQLSHAQETEITMDSNELAMELMKDLRDGRVTRSANQKMELILPILSNLTVENVNQQLKIMWAADHRLVLVTGNLDLSGTDTTPEETILNSFRQSNMAVVRPPVQEKTFLFPYLPAPEVGEKIIRSKQIVSLGIEQAWLKNGVYLSMKRTNFKKGEALISLAFGSGKASEPKDKPGLAYLAEAMFNEAGFGRMNRTELDEALSGRIAGIELDIREDMFLLNGKASSDEVPLLFQLMRTFILDPGVRQETLELVRKRLIQQIRTAQHEVQGVMQIEGIRFLSGGDNRLGLATPEELEQLTLDDIRTWFQEQLSESGIELAAVGDIDPQQVKELAAIYMSSLPLRTDHQITALNDSHPRFPAGESLTLKADSQIQNSLVVVAYPTADMWDIEQTRRLALLSEVFSEQLRVRVREKLGAAYSPYAYNRPYRAYPGFGIFFIFVEAAPDEVETVVSEVKQIAEGLHTQNISLDEFRRALDPTLTRIKDLRQSNTYWLNSVMIGSGRYPQQIQWAQTIEDDYAAITKDDIRIFAERYLINKNSAIVLVQPEK